MYSKTFTTFCALIVAAGSFAQPVLPNCENFSVGMKLKFQQCATSNVPTGSTGASQVWDFTTLVKLADTAIEDMVAPASTFYGSQYPGANLVERYNDGTFAYLNKTADSTYLVGFADSIKNYTMHYPNPLLFITRPISYGIAFADSFTVNYTSSSLNFFGKGVNTVSADGWGTLKLPGATYSNVLRLTIIQTQNDTNSSVNIVSTTVTHAWFDNAHASALLKIDSTNAGAFISQSVEYFISESAGTPEVAARPALQLYPNPVTDKLFINSAEKGVLIITNELGQRVSTVSIAAGVNTVNTNELPRGVYHGGFVSGGMEESVVFVVR